MSVRTTFTSTRENHHPVTTLRVVDESDHYTSAVAGVTLEGTRVDRGTGPNVVLAVTSGALAVTSSHFGFPMTSGAGVPKDRIVAAYIHRNPAGSRWCGTVLGEDAVVVYTPGSEHIALNRPGLHFTFVITEPERLMSDAEARAVHCELPASCGLHVVPRSACADRFGARLQRMTTTAIAGQAVERQAHSLLESMVEVFAGDPPVRTGDRGRGLDSGAIVADCVDYARAIDRIPTNAELCVAAHVSERRLRSAFAEEFDCPPTRYFKFWALDRAHRRLRDAAPDEQTVSKIACDLGFDHLGRFAGSYRAVFGEAPSETLSVP